MQIYIMPSWGNQSFFLLIYSEVTKAEMKYNFISRYMNIYEYIPVYLPAVVFFSHQLLIL